MKVLYLITKSNWGGAQRYVYDLATALPPNHEAVVAFGGTGVPGSEAGQLEHRLKEVGIKTRLIKSYGRNMNVFSDLKIFWDTWKLIYSEKPHAVHLNSPKAIGVGALMARLNGVPHIVATIHGWTFNESRPGWQKKLITFFQWLSVILTTKTIAICEADYQQSQNWLLVKNKIVLIHNGLAPFALVPKIEARQVLSGLAKELNNHLDKTWIGANSELHPNKGYDFLLPAFAKLPADNILVIISSGQEKENLEKLAQELNIAERTFFVGFVPDARVYLKAFDIFTMPSRKEGLPYVILEAGHAALPVVASSVGGIPDIIKDGQNGLLFPVGDIAALTRHLQTLIASPTLRTDLGNALHHTTQSAFSLDEMVSKTIRLY